MLRAESDDPGRRGVAVVCTAALEALATASELHEPRFGDARERALDALPLCEQMTVGYAFRRGLPPETGAAELLAECGTIDPTPRTITPLGQRARPELTQPPAPRVTWDDTDLLELRIDLDHFRPPVWRRVRLPAATTLSELHEIIQILFEWDGDHLHVFTVDGARYADPTHGLDGCADTDELTLAAALPRPRRPPRLPLRPRRLLGTTPCGWKQAARAPPPRPAPPASAAAATPPSRTGPTTTHHPARSISPS